MKKIYLFAAAMFMAATTFGQYDLAVELTNPASGSTVEVSEIGQLTFDLVNYGPDAVDVTPASGEGVWLMIQIIDPATQQLVAAYDLDGVANGVTGVQFGGSFDAGMYSEFDDAVLPTSNLQPGYMVVVSALGVAPQDQSIIMDLAENGDPNDADNSNNFDFFFIGDGSSSIAINEKDVKVFPNPANDFVTFQIDGLENGNVVISSITGQEVINTSLNGVAKVDVSALNNGVYIYKITNSNGELIKTSKLVIQK